MPLAEPSAPVYLNGEPFPLRAALLRDPAPLLLLLLPFGLLALDSSWIYSSPFRDPWIYYGYFHNATRYADEFPNEYFSSRLSVILPGFLLYRMLALPALAGNLVLRLALFWTAILSFYGVCKIALGPRVALLSSIALGCHPFFLLAVGNNYVDGFGIAYFLLAQLLLTLAPRCRPWRLCLVAAGAAATALVTANLFYVVYLPFLAAWFLFVNRGPARRPLLPAISLATAGATALFLAFGAVNRLFGGPFFYLLGSIRFSLTTVQQSTSIFFDATYSWLDQATWLVLPVIVLLGSVPFLWRARREPEASKRRYLVAAQVQFLLLAALFTWLHVWAGRAVLQYHYYASLLLPFAYFALAAQMEPLLSRLSPRSFRLLATAAALALAASLTVSFNSDRLDALVGPPVLLPAVAGLGVALVVWLGSAGVRVGLRMGLLLVLCLASSQELAEDIASPFHQFTRFYGGDAKGFFLQVDRSFTLLQQADPSHLQLRLWYDIYDGSAGRFCDVVASTFLLCTRMVGGHFPRLESDRMCDGTQLVPGLRIAVLSARPDAAAQAQASLRGIGLASRVAARREIGGPVRGFAITFLEVLPAETMR